MSALTFQQSLAQMLTDAELRAAVFDHDKRSLEAFDIATEDRDRLQSMDRERVTIFAELLLANRLSKAIDGLPLTAALLADQLGPIGWSFNQACPPKHSKKFNEATAFGEYLNTYFESHPPMLPYIQDVLAFEMAALEIRFGFDGCYGGDEVKVGDAALLALAGGSFPVRLAHNRILMLNHNVELIGERIARGEIPPAEDEQPMLVLVNVEPSGVLAQAEINLATLAFIEECDGTSTLDQIVASLGLQFSQTADDLDEFEALCVDLCTGLVERRIVGLTSIGAVA